jgi:MarR family transcriptional regulator, transcriptional regulator for hemolysin
VKSGLVVRQPSTQDRRVKHVILTPAGNRLYDKVKTEAAALRKELLADIEVKKLEAATALLEKLQGMFEAGT